MVWNITVLLWSNELGVDMKCCVADKLQPAAVQWTDWEMAPCPARCPAHPQNATVEESLSYGSSRGECPVWIATVYWHKQVEAAENNRVLRYLIISKFQKGSHRIRSRRQYEYQGCAAVTVCKCLGEIKWGWFNECTPQSVGYKFLQHWNNLEREKKGFEGIFEICLKP